MTFFKALTVCFLALAVSASAEVRLLTGDANNNIHDNDGQIRDISPDGRLILFLSGPSNSATPTPGITRGGLYLRDLVANSLTFVGVPVGGESNNNPTDAVEATMSDDGRYLTWSSSTKKIFWRDHQAGVTRSITPTADGDCRRPLISADGRYVVYISVARNLIADTALLPPAGHGSIYLYDSQTQTTSIVSLRHNGTALTSGVGTGAGMVVDYDFSSDGKYVFFATTSNGVHPDRPDGNAFQWIYRRNLATGAIDVANRNASGSLSLGNFSTPRCDATGNRVVFTGTFIGVFGGAQMTADYNQALGTFDIFLKDLTTAATWRISKTTDNSANDGAFSAGGPAISDDGQVVAFGSSGTKHVVGTTDPSGGDSFDIFRVDVGSAGAITTTLITTAVFGGDNVGFFNGPFVAGNGSYVAFETSYIFALYGSGPTTSINHQSFGVGTFPATGPSFTTWAAALPAGDRDLLDIPQNDGITNLQKFIHGIDPLSSSKANLPVGGKAIGNDLGLDGDSNTYLTVSFAVIKDLPPGFSWSVWAATSLDDLSNNPTPANIVGSPEEVGSTEVYTFRSPFTLNGNNQGFFKVVLSGE